jgi:hypothetical protein
MASPPRPRRRPPGTRTPPESRLQPVETTLPVCHGNQDASGSTETMPLGL